MRTSCDLAMILLAGLVLFPTGCAKVHFICDDTVIWEGRDSFLSATLVTRTGFGTMRPKDVEVVFYADGVEVARARTGGEGYVYKIDRLPIETETLEARAVVGGKEYRSQGRVFNWKEDRVVIICDIDGTIARTSVTGLVFKERDTKSKPMPMSSEVLHALSKKYHLAYLTARPIYLREKSQAWLDNNGFPKAPLVTFIRVRESADAVRYKSEIIEAIHALYPEALIGIGNAGTDMEAYAANGMLPLIADDGEGRLFSAHAIQLQTWGQLARFFDANERLLQDDDALRDVITSGGMLLQPVIPWNAGS
jgi:hypothetical protein